jgi:hypothetical protein
MIIYFVGFYLGRKYEQAAILEDTVGVLAEVDKNNLEVTSVTYYYSQELYDAKVKELKDIGEEYYE